MTEEELKTEIERLKKLITALQKRISLIKRIRLPSIRRMPDKSLLPFSKTLPKSYFADRENRRFPIYDIPHVRYALAQWNILMIDSKGKLNTSLESQREKMRLIHDRILKAAKKFDIKTRHVCEFCEPIKVMLV